MRLRAGRDSKKQKTREAKAKDLKDVDVFEDFEHATPRYRFGNRDHAPAESIVAVRSAGCQTHADSMRIPDLRDVAAHSRCPKYMKRGLHQKPLLFSIIPYNI